MNWEKGKLLEKRSKRDARREKGTVSPGKAVNLLLLKKFYERHSLMVLSDSSGSSPMFIGSEPI
jgi:hypothetical protein